jgi:hypothetical protein
MDSAHNTPEDTNTQTTSSGQFLFWQRWLFVFSLAFIVFGLALALFNGTPMFDLLNRQVDPAFWGTEEIPMETLVFQRWIYGVAGATMSSWGVLLAYIIYYPLRRREKWAWNCLAIGMLAWFLPDFAVSLYFGVFFNMIFSTLCVTVIFFPLTMLRKYYY